MMGAQHQPPAPMEPPPQHSTPARARGGQGGAPRRSGMGGGAAPCPSPRADEARQLDPGGVAHLCESDDGRRGDERAYKPLHCLQAFTASPFRGWARRRWSIGLAVDGP